ncbi:unnamed protein product [Blepharisma stoltei]|uniref:PLAC8 family protein n=1 Tax=Blepharisma stoltei TaxID=1481888 RepID=A0AAU9IPR9_9CILI|nr:unnamed protein product [Blepharisma stoltei]
MSENEWGIRLFECFRNPQMFAWAIFVPWGTACMHASEAKILMKSKDESVALKRFLCNACLCCFGCAWNRRALRKELVLDGNYFIDLMLWIFCPCCAATQEWQEVMVKKDKDSKVAIWNLA